MKTSMVSQDASFDQVFMKDRKLLEKIVSFADIGKEDTVLEIGAGSGALTDAIAGRCRKVMAIEKDERLKPVLTGNLSGHKNVEIVIGNALDIIPGGLSCDAIVSNPPYSISEPLIRALFGKRFRTAVLTLPTKFVGRLIAGPDDACYSKLSLFAQAFFSIETLLHVGRDAWEPRPDTDSDVIRLTPRKSGGMKDSFLRELILQDDKKLKNALREAMVRISGKTKRSAKESVQEMNLPEGMLGKKISELSLSEFKRITGSFP